MSDHLRFLIRSCLRHLACLEEEVEELVADAKSLLYSGYRGIKMKVGTDPVHEDLRRVQAVREAIGPNIDLMGMPTVADFFPTLLTSADGLLIFISNGWKNQSAHISSQIHRDLTVEASRLRISQTLCCP